MAKKGEKSVVEKKAVEVKKVDSLKSSYKVKVIKMAFGGNRILKYGEVIKTAKYEESVIKNWLANGLIG